MQFIIFLSFLLGGSFIFHSIQAATAPTLILPNSNKESISRHLLKVNHTKDINHNHTSTASLEPRKLLLNDNKTVGPIIHGDSVSKNTSTATTSSAQENASLKNTVVIPANPESKVDMVTVTPIDSGENETETTTEPLILYLEFEYEFTSREEFWKENKFECVDGKMAPSPYLRRKYRECEIVHRPNPKCTRNCQQAITMLLGEKRTPELSLYKSYFETTLPIQMQGMAIRHMSNCFDSYGKNEEDFLDFECEKPQKFLECAKKLDNSIPCV